MYGGCAALAIAIHNITRLPIVALIEPAGETERAVHVMIKAPDGRYLDINGLHTYAEVLADLCDNHDCDTQNWSLISASLNYLKACIQDEIFDPITPQIAAEARQVAKRLIAACL